MGNIFGDAWDGVKDLSGDVADRLGFGRTPKVNHALGKELGRPYQVDDRNFDPRLNQHFMDAFGDTQSNADDARRRVNNPTYERDMNMGPSGTGPRNYGGPAPVKVGQVGPARTTSVDFQTQVANGMLDQANNAREGQVSNLDFLDSVRRGEGPSAGQDLANQAGERASYDYRRNANAANTQFGQAQNSATGVYGDALGEQGYLTRQAGQQAGQRFQDANQAGLRGQAALMSSARGGNIGMGLRAGMMNAATMSQGANIEAGRAQMAANQQASYNAANAQRAAFNANSAANLQTTGAQQAADINATGAMTDAMYQGAAIRSGEQLDAMSQFTGAANTVREQDLTGANTATNLANTGLNTDEMVNRYLEGDVQRTFEGDKFNNEMKYNYSQLNEDAAQAWDTNDTIRSGMDQDNTSKNKDRLVGNAQFTQTQLAEMAMFGVSSLQELELAKMTAFDNGKSRRTSFETGGMGLTGALSGSSGQRGAAVIGGLATGGAAYLAWKANQGRK